MTINCHCTDRDCGRTIEVDFCGKQPETCTCAGLMFCTKCGEQLDYTTLHDEAVCLGLGDDWILPAWGKRAKVAKRNIDALLDLEDLLRPRC